MANPTSRSSSPLYPLSQPPSGPAKNIYRQRVIAPRTNHTTDASGKGSFIAKFGVPGLPLEYAASSKNEINLALHSPQGTEPQLLLEPSSDSSSAGACTDITGKWVDKPFPKILDVAFRTWGASDDGVWLVIAFDVTIEITAEIDCLRCGHLTKTKVRLGPYKTIFPYKNLIMSLFMPQKLSRGLSLIKFFWKGVHLVEFFKDNQELIELLLDNYSDIIDLMANSADLICKGHFKIPQPKPDFVCPTICA